MIMEIGLLMGLVAVASNPSPYYAALGLVGGAGAGCLMLAEGGVSFLSLVLFLVYLGGMMVVFAYCAALVAEPYPEAWGSFEVTIYMMVYAVFLGLGWKYWGGSMMVSVEKADVIMGDWWGVGELLCGGGWLLFSGGWGLLLTLFVALELVRGHKAGALRAV